MNNKIATDSNRVGDGYQIREVRIWKKVIGWYGDAKCSLHDVWESELFLQTKYCPKPECLHTCTSEVADVGNVKVKY